MSTRRSIFYHDDDQTNVSIHVYEEALDRTIHLEVEHAYGVTNVLWPHAEFVEDILHKSALKMAEHLAALQS